MAAILRCLHKTIWTGDALSPSIFKQDKVVLGSDFSLIIRMMDCSNKEVVYDGSTVTGMTCDIRYGDVIVKEKLNLTLDNITNRYTMVLSSEDFTTKGSYKLTVGVTNTDGSVFYQDFFVEIS